MTTAVAMMKGKMYASSMVWLLLLSLVIDSQGTIHRQRVNNGLNAIIEHRPSIIPTYKHHSSAPANSITMNKWTKPFFDISVPNNVTALVGKSAYLTCRVRNLGNYTVSWIRHRDLLILTVASYTFTTDQRFQTAYHRDTNEWTLHIKWVQPLDAGMYECQISTQPVMSYSVQLNTIGLLNEHLYRTTYSDQQNDDNRSGIGDDDANFSESFMGIDEKPIAKILGERDQYVNKGSTINLTCVIEIDPDEPRYILWYHENQMIGVDLAKDEVILNKRTEDITTSYLIIQKADMVDSGKYTCAPSNAAPTSIIVHVLQGERTGAMQTSASFKPRPVCVGVFASAALTSVIAHVHNIAVDVPLAASTPVALATATTFVCRLIKVICEYGIAIIKLMLTKDCMRALIPR